MASVCMLRLLLLSLSVGRQSVSVSAETLRRNRRNCKIGANCNTGSLAVRLLAVGGQGGACASWCSIDDPKFDSTASHPSSSSHSLPRRVVCHSGQPAPMIMGGLVKESLIIALII